MRAIAPFTLFTGICAANAEPGDGVTTGDVAAVDANKKVGYVISLLLAGLAQLLSAHSAWPADTGAVNVAANTACISYMADTDWKTLVYAPRTPCDGLTVRDVAAMDSRGNFLFLFGMAARPVYRIGEKAGSEAIKCLHGHFLEYPLIDGERHPPRGMKGLIRVIERAANNGGLDELAYLNVRSGVNWVAENVCHIDPQLLVAAPDSSR